MSKHLSYGASLLALGAVLSGQAAAATRGAPVSNNVIEELIVTAQKRQERLQDVPISVAVVTGEALATQGIGSTTELTTIVPDLNFTQSANVRGEGFSIRGVGTAAFSDSVEQSVGTVVDGVAYARTGQAVADLVDVDHVEVLRGPQGFLFGKNASAGVVSITTKRPSFTPGFEGRVSYATLDELKLSGVANLPLRDDLAVRIAYASTKADGIIDNIFRKEELNNRDSRAVRAKALWNASDRFSVYLIGDWSRSRANCCAWTLRSAPPSTVLGKLTAAAGVTPGENNLQVASDQPFFQNGDAYGGSAEINYDFGWGTLTSVTAARDWKTNDNNDPDLLPVDYLQVNSGRSHLVQKSEELRLTSPAHQRFAWIAGLYADRVQNQSHVNQSGAVLTLPSALYIGSAADSTTVNRSAAAFGQVSYAFTDKLKVLAGARYTDEVLSTDFNSYLAPGSVIPLGTPGRTRGRTRERNVSGRLTLQYQWTPEVMSYVSAARGYKGPGLNIAGTSGVPSIIHPEIPTAYEAGLRSVLLDGRVVFNATAFAAQYKDYQAQVFDQTITPAAFRVTNAGKLDTRGLELEVLARPATDTVVNVSAAYVDAKYADFKNLSCYLGQPQLPLGTPRTSPRQCIVVSGTTALTYGDGLPLTNQPKLTYNLGLQQTWRLDRFDLDGRVSWNWRDKVVFTANGDPGARQGAYGLLGAGLSLSPHSGPWKMSLFAKNLLDKRFAAYVFPSPVVGAAGVYAQFPSADARRIVGAMLEVKF